MNYTELKAKIADVTENTFSEDAYQIFVALAEERIYSSADLPVLRKNSTGTLTTSNQYLSVPADYRYTYSLAVISAAGAFSYPVNKDVNFIREAYPNPTSTGVPKYYADFDEGTLIVGPSPDSGYSVELHYGYFPESIITATTTWLSDNYEGVLLNACLLEAARFMKAEEDIVNLYNEMYGQSLLLLKNLADGKLRGDTYRSGQPKKAVK